MTTYQKYEFCRDRSCDALINGRCTKGLANCNLTAKHFHHWLKENNFVILKKLVEPVPPEVEEKECGWCGGVVSGLTCPECGEEVNYL